MYVNPWRYSVGDLVSTLDTYSCTTWTSVITERRRRSVYVEARPIACIEIDEYCIVHDDVKHWVVEHELQLCQASLQDKQESTVLSSGEKHE